MLNAIRHNAKKLYSALIYRAKVSKKTEQGIADRFHELVYDAGTLNRAWGTSTWFGVPCRKLPFDLWAYQEILNEVKPDLIIETGTFKGGSALYLAHLCDLLGQGEIVTVDVEDHGGHPTHPRITYMSGSSTDPKIVAQIKARAAKAQRVLVILDSDHSYKHVRDELAAYAPLVTIGSYVVVEDTNINGHPVYKEFGPGPHEAATEFVKAHKNFINDKKREQFYVSFNVDGYLKRIS